jgi:hypothetical protein
VPSSPESVLAPWTSESDEEDWEEEDGQEYNPVEANVQFRMKLGRINSKNMAKKDDPGENCNSERKEGKSQINSSTREEEKQKNEEGGKALVNLNPVQEMPNDGKVEIEKTPETGEANVHIQEESRGGTNAVDKSIPTAIVAGKEKETKFKNEGNEVEKGQKRMAGKEPDLQAKAMDGQENVMPVPDEVNSAVNIPEANATVDESVE